MHRQKGGFNRPAEKEQIEIQEETKFDWKRVSFVMHKP